MTLQGLCVTLGSLWLLGGNAVASPVDESQRYANVETEEAIELFVTCEGSFPFLSLRWDNRNSAKAAYTASAFLNAPAITPQLIVDKAAECFSVLKSEPGMFIVHFYDVQLRCGVGPDIKQGHIVVGHVY